MDVRDSILKAVDEVLDKMVFLYFEEDQPEDGTPGEFSYITQVEISGIIVGTLNLLLSEAVAILVARNLLGIRDEDALFDGTVEDALGELTNLIGGRMMTLLHPPGPFNIEIPRIVNETVHSAAGQSELVIMGTLDEERFGIRLAYHETPN